MSQTFQPTAENATYLLAAAAELGLPKDVVKVEGGYLTAPDDVIKQAAKQLQKADRESARTSEIAASSQPAKTATKKAATKKTGTKKTATKKTAAKPADKE